MVAQTKRVEGQHVKAGRAVDEYDVPVSLGAGKTPGEQLGAHDLAEALSGGREGRPGRHEFQRFDASGSYWKTNRALHGLQKLRPVASHAKVGRRAALRIQIDEEHAFTHFSKRGCEVHSGRGLSHASLVVRYSNDPVHEAPPPAFSVLISLR